MVSTQSENWDIVEWVMQWHVMIAWFSAATERLLRGPPRETTRRPKALPRTEGG